MADHFVSMYICVYVFKFMYYVFKKKNPAIRNTFSLPQLMFLLQFLYTTVATAVQIYVYMYAFSVFSFKVKRLDGPH